jgi:hypothetical protein
MKELLRGKSTISLEAAVLKCPNAELYLLLLPLPPLWAFGSVTGYLYLFTNQL